MLVVPAGQRIGDFEPFTLCEGGAGEHWPGNLHRLGHTPPRVPPLAGRLGMWPGSLRSHRGVNAVRAS